MTSPFSCCFLYIKKRVYFTCILHSDLFTLFTAFIKDSVPVKASLTGLMPRRMIDDL